MTAKVTGTQIKKTEKGFLTPQAVTRWNNGVDITRIKGVKKLTSDTPVEIVHYHSGKIAINYSGTCTWVKRADYRLVSEL